MGRDYDEILAVARKYCHVKIVPVGFPFDEEL